MTRNILVTGGAGYIGSHMLKELKAQGATCVVVDDLSTGHPEAVVHGRLEQISLLDEDALGALFARETFDAVIHFAASSIVSESVANPEKYYKNNIVGTKTLVDAMTRAGVRTLVFSSSAAVYGVPQTTPIEETHPCAPVNPYGSTKLAIEMMLRDYAGAGLLQYAALRYFNAAGADPQGEIGESHQPETHLIPIALQAAAGLRDGMDVYGSDYATPDGTCLRDYVHVTDLCRAHYQALEYLAAGGKSRAFNLGTGRGYSVKEVIACVKRVTGKDFSVRMAPRRAGDPPALVADGTCAKEVLGWTPVRAELDLIVQDAWRWECKKRNAA